MKALVLIAVVLGAVPAAAQAGSRYAAPTAQGSGDCTSAANACPIAMAVSGAVSGDDIFVLANLGDYNLGTTGVSDSSKTLHFHGMSGRPRLLAAGPATTLTLNHASSSADDLYLQNSNATNGEPLHVSPGSGNTATVNNVIANQTGNDHPCYFGGGVTWTNSVCWESSTNASDLAVETDGTNTMRNDVIWAAGSPSVGIRAFGRSGVPGDDILINTIVRATGSGDADLAANAQDGTTTATFDVSYSNFATTRAEGTAGMDHFNTGSTDQSALPMLVNPGAGDFHELAGSPTIDAGTNDPANGSADFDGDPRIDVATGRTDIGADEFEQTAGGGSPPPSNPPPGSCNPLLGTCPPSQLQLVCIDFVIGSCNGVFPTNSMIETNTLDPMHLFCKNEETTQPGFGPQGPGIAMNYACDTTVDATAERTGILAQPGIASVSKKPKRRRLRPLLLASAHTVIPAGTDKIVALPLTSAAKKVLGNLRKRHYRGAIKVTLKVTISQPPGAKTVTGAKTVNMHLNYRNAKGKHKGKQH